MVKIFKEADKMYPHMLYAPKAGKMVFVSFEPYVNASYVHYDMYDRHGTITAN